MLSIFGKSIRIFITFLCCFPFGEIQGQNAVPTTSIRNVPLYEMLPSNSVVQLLQDSDGFMWLGTLDGLCRYDGYQLKVFRSNLNNPGLLPDNEITCLAEDLTGRIIVGTPAGAVVLDKRDYTFTRLTGAAADQESVKTVAVSADGSIWVGTRSRLLRYTSELEFVRHYDPFISGSTINSIYLDPDGSMWVTAWRKGLYKYDPQEDRFIKFPRIGAQDNPFKLLRDASSRLWILSYYDGIFRFDPDSPDPYRRMEILADPSSRELNSSFSIAQDQQNGYFWVVSNSGLHQLEYVGENHFRELDISHVIEKSNNIFSEIIRGRNGIMWLGSFGEGLWTLDSRSSPIQNITLDFVKRQAKVNAKISAVIEDSQKTLWMNQDRKGLLLYDQQDGSHRFYDEIPLLKGLPGLNSVAKIVRSHTSDRAVWVIPQHHSLAYCLGREAGKVNLYETLDVSQFAPEDAGSVPQILNLFEDRSLNTWISTSAGIFIRTAESGEVVRISGYGKKAVNFAESPSGTVWIATENDGIMVIDPEQKEMTGHYGRETGDLPGNTIESMCADTRGCIWIALKEGNIIVYDSQTGTFADRSSAFRIAGQRILDLAVDDSGHIWVMTAKSVTEYNPDNQAQIVYTPADGIAVNSFMKNAWFKTPENRMIFGGNNGLTVITPSPDMSTLSAHYTQVAVTDVKVNGRSLLLDRQAGEFDPIARKIRFGADARNIEINFSSFEFTPSPRTRFAYRMAGVDNDWIYTSEDRQVAAYNALQKGRRTFYVKASDGNNLWSQQVTAIEIYKRPAWYESGWACLCYFLILVIAAYTAYVRANNRVRLRNELRIKTIEKEKNEELTQTKLRYFTNISHDFLTPLTIVSCVIDDIEKNRKIGQEEIGIARANITRLKRLLQQVLDFRKIENGRMELRLTRTELVAFVRELCYTNFSPLIKKKELEFVFTSPVNRLEGNFDTDKIDKILFNLLSNAVKYTPRQGKIHVDIRAYDADGGRRVKIRVSDTGIGIPAGNLQAVFTRFNTNLALNPEQGNGVGLSLTKELVELHGGTISVESTEGQGTCFTVDLPVDPEDVLTTVEKPEAAFSSRGKESSFLPDTLASAEAGPVCAEEKTGGSGNITVLLVEDNEELLRLVSKILSKQYRVKTAYNGKEALQLMETQEIDLVVSDVMMPGMDGLELCRFLKSSVETSHIPVLLLTAKNSTEDRIACYDAGADGYIAKPFSLPLLEARIRNFLDHRKERQHQYRTSTDISISSLPYLPQDKQFLAASVVAVEANLAEEDFDVNRLSEELNISKSTLYRKIKSLTGLSPVEYIRNIRLKHACQLLLDPAITVSEVAYLCGFSNPKYFATCFRKEFNLTPSQYQDRQAGKTGQ